MPALMHPRGAVRQRGLSIVELMVGITIGLIIVAGASVLLSGQIVENRRLVAEAQVQQDLRATADIITRELRRSGALGTDTFLLQRIWIPGSVTDPAANMHSALLSPASGAAPDDQVAFNYYPTGPGTDGPPGVGFGFRLDTTRGVIETNLRAGGWQDLTDPATVNITRFEVERLDDTQVRLPCARPCADSTSNCWPTINTRTFLVRFTAQSRSLPDVVRSHQSRVRVRNEHLQFFTHTADITLAAVCPAS